MIPGQFNMFKTQKNFDKHFRALLLVNFDLRRINDSNLQHVKGKQVETVKKRYHRRYIIYVHYHDYIGNFQHLLNFLCIVRAR